MDPSEWTEEEMNMFAIIFAAASAAMAAGEYCRNYLFRNPPRRADNERAWIINGIIRATDNDCISQLRMRKTTFFHLSSVLRDNNKLNDAKHVSMEEQLVMFLHTLGHNVRNRVIGHRFIRSGETVSRYFNRVLDAIVSLYPTYVQLPGPDTPPEITSNPNWNNYFQDCIGAIDGTHIPAFVPSNESGVYRNRKGIISQNVMAVCDFDMKFVYMLAGWEGSASDARVLQSALTDEHDRFTVREGKYYVVDAGYAHSPGFMAPYRGVRYHLNEYRTGRNPANVKELFNYRHAQLRNVIERCFGVLKSRFPILKTAPQYPVVTQVKIVLACCVLHNFIRLSGDDEIVDADGTSGDGDIGLSPLTLDNAAINDLRNVLNAPQTERDAWIAFRDNIAQRMWNDYSTASQRILEDTSSSTPMNARSQPSTPTKRTTGSNAATTPRRTPKKNAGKSVDETLSPGGILRWTDVMDNCLIDSLVEQVANGKKSGHGFKKETYKPCVDNIRDKLEIILTSKNVINRLRTVKKLYFTIRDLRSASGFGWDDGLKVVVATDDVWVDYIKSHPYAQHVRGKPCSRYDDLEYIFGDDRATGKRCATGNYNFNMGSFGGLRNPDDPMTQTVDLNSTSVDLGSDDFGDSGPTIHWEWDSREGVNIPHSTPSAKGNNSNTTNSSANSRKRARATRPTDVIGTGLTDMAEALQSIATNMTKGKNFARMAVIIPELEQLDGLNGQEVLSATKLLSKEEEYGAAFLNLPNHKRLDFLRMLMMSNQ